MNTFKIGDKVRGYGIVGYVVAIEGEYVGVEHEEFKRGFHNLSGLLLSRRGWWYDPVNLDLLARKQTFKGNKQ